MEANGTEPLPVQPAVDTLILNGDAAEREEADPAKKKKKKKKKSKSAATGECLIQKWVLTAEAPAVLRCELCLMSQINSTQDWICSRFV